MRNIIDQGSRWLDDETSANYVETLRKAHRGIACLPTVGTTPIVDGTPDGPLPDDGDDFSRNERIAKGALAAAGVRIGRKLGCGTYGCAYEGKLNGEDIVVKITGDAAEAAAAQGVLSAIADGRTSWKQLAALAKLKCVYSFVDGAGEQIPVYAVLQEKLGELPRKDRKFIDLHRWLLVIDHPTVPKLAKAALGRAGVDNARRVSETRTELARIGIFWGDVHSGNLLADADGRWTIIDLGASNNERGVDVPALFA